MSWEPSSLAEYDCEQRLIDEFVAAHRNLPALLPSLDLGEYIYHPEHNVNEIHRLSGRDINAGIELHPLLVPGPADMSFVIAKRRGDLSDVLSALDHWEFATVVFVIRGGLLVERLLKYQGNTFQQNAWAGAMHMTVIPARSEQRVVIESGSILLFT